jgi:hypothetical protein
MASPVRTDRNFCLGYAVRQDNSFVRDFVILLARKRNPSTIQFNNESVLVDHFVVALSQLAMNFHAKTHQLKDFFLVKQFRHELRELRRLYDRDMNFTNSQR